MRYLLTVVALLCLWIGAVGCANDKPKTKLIYFGFDDGSEKPEDVIRMVRDWSHPLPCPHWRATIKKQEADFQVLFGGAEQVTVVGRRGEVLYHGGEGVLELAHGNPDGSGVNLCKLTGE